MIWIELRKALRSRMPLWTALGSLFMPLGIAFLIFVARNPEIAQPLGLVSAKANIVAYAATDWATYLRVYAEIMGAGGLILFILILSWIFGREFADGTLKDMLAVPVQTRKHRPREIYRDGALVGGDDLGYFRRPSAPPS